MPTRCSIWIGFDTDTSLIESMIRAVAILVASSITATAVTMTFSWGAVPGATSYKLLRGSTADTVTNLHGTTSTNSITVTNVPLGMYWRVVAANDIGIISEPSDAIILRIGVVRAGTVRASAIGVR